MVDVQGARPHFSEVTDDLPVAVFSPTNVPTTEVLFDPRSTVTESGSPSTQCANGTPSALLSLRAHMGRKSWVFIAGPVNAIIL